MSQKLLVPCYLNFHAWSHLCVVSDIKWAAALPIHFEGSTDNVTVSVSLICICVCVWVVSDIKWAALQNHSEGTTDNVTVSQCDVDCPCCPLLSLSSQGINWIMGRAALERERRKVLHSYFFKAIVQIQDKGKFVFTSSMAGLNWTLFGFPFPPLSPPPRLGGR